MKICGLQYDSTGPLPFTPALQAFYYNGRYAHRPVTFGRGRVWIDVLGSAPLDCFWADVEQGDITPGHIPGWLAQRHQAGMGWGGVYCNRSALPDVLEAVGALPMALWLATLDGTIPDPDSLHLPPSVRLAAVQAFPQEMAGFHADISVVTDPDYWAARHA